MKRTAWIAFLLLAACPPAPAKKEPLPTTCKSIGQNCEFSPGKLGTCVLRDECTGNDCYVCQSQH
jgi:hypothetical protein